MIPQHGTVEQIPPACYWLFLNLTGRTNANSIDSSGALKKLTFFGHKILGTELGARILM